MPRLSLCGAGIEADVLASPSWGAVVAAHRPYDADVLVPELHARRDTPRYQHWAANSGYLRTLKQTDGVYSLVSAGRYSQRFMEHMRWRWEAGEAWYEEIVLPTACLELGEGCKLGVFFGQEIQRARHDGAFRYRPFWPCSEMLQRASSLPTNLTMLWHPIKARKCWLHHLDASAPMTTRLVTVMLDAAEDLFAEHLWRILLGYPPAAVALLSVPLLCCFTAGMKCSRLNTIE